MKEIAVALSVREDAVWDDLKRLPEAVERTAPITASPKAEASSALRLLGGLILWQEGLTEKERTIDVEKIKKELGAISGETLLFVSAIGESEREERVFEVEARFGASPSLEKEVRALLLHIEKETLEKKSAELLNELTVAEQAQKDEPQRQKLLSNLQSVRLRIETLKRASSEA